MRTCACGLGSRGSKPLSGIPAGRKRGHLRGVPRSILAEAHGCAPKPFRWKELLPLHHSLKHLHTCPWSSPRLLAPHSLTPTGQPPPGSRAPHTSLRRASTLAAPTAGRFFLWSFSGQLFSRFGSHLKRRRSREFSGGPAPHNRAGSLRSFHHCLRSHASAYTADVRVPTPAGGSSVAQCGHMPLPCAFEDISLKQRIFHFGHNNDTFKPAVCSVM